MTIEDLEERMEALENMQIHFHTAIEAAQEGNDTGIEYQLEQAEIYADSVEMDIAAVGNIIKLWGYANAYRKHIKRAQEGAERGAVTWLEGSINAATRCAEKADMNELQGREGRIASKGYRRAYLHSMEDAEKDVQKGSHYGFESNLLNACRYANKTTGWRDFLTRRDLSERLLPMLSRGYRRAYLHHMQLASRHEDPRTIVELHDRDFNLYSAQYCAVLGNLSRKEIKRSIRR